MSSDVTMLVLQWEMLFQLFNIWPFNWFQHGAVSSRRNAYRCTLDCRPLLAGRARLEPVPGIALLDVEIGR